MKKVLLGLLLLAVPALSGCEKQLLHFVTTFESNKVYEIDQTGAFEQSLTITPEEVRSTLDLPDDATITKIEIESLSLRVKPQPGNQATAVTVSGSINDGTGARPLFTNYPLVLTGVNFPFLGLNSLIEEGIVKLKVKLNDYVKRLNDNVSTVTLTGSPTPANSRILVNIVLKIRATIEYTDCMDVPAPITDGEKCPAEAS